MHVFKRLLTLCALMMSALVGASCPSGTPSNYTTVSGTRTDTSGRTVTFTICYPASMIVNNTYNLYVSMSRSGTAGTTGVADLCGFLPTNNFSFGSSVVVNFPAPTTFSTGLNCGNRGDYLFSSGLGTTDSPALYIPVTPTVSGVYSYAASGTLDQAVGTLSLPITITVLDNCPTVTADGGTGCAAGNISGFVTGGTSPYIFSQTGTSVGGPVSLGADGSYTFGGAGTGSFQYFATDVAGCPSNVATVNVSSNPSLDTGSILYNMTAGVSTTQTINVTGGTPPYTFNTVGSFPIVNGSVSFNSLTNEFTFTQTTPGASRMTIQATDANGCVSNTRNIFFYSCAPGRQASAALGNNDSTFALIYAICYPAYVPQGQVFDITISLININPEGPVPSGPFRDFLPDPSQPLFAPGLSYVGNSGLPPEVLSFAPPPPTASLLNEGGLGQIVYQLSIPSGAVIDVVAQISANASGLQRYTATNIFNPGNELAPEVTIQVGPPCSVVATSNGYPVCVDGSQTGNLNDFVIGGSGPFTFGPSGATASGGVVSINPSGPFTFTAASGFIGTGSFTYDVTDFNGCISTGIITFDISSPQANTGSGTGCAGSSINGSLAGLVSQGFPPYNFSIVTNGTLGTATITDSSLGTFEYVPFPNSFGNDFFTFQVTDINGCVTIGTFQIVINQAPTTTPLLINDCINTPVGGGLAQQVVGPLPLTFNLTGTPFGGTASIDPTGNFVFIPTNGYTGPAGFVYEVTDNNGCSTTGVVDITVSIPVVSPSGVSTCLNTPVSGDLGPLVTSGFPGYTFGLLTSVGGNATVSSTGLYNYTPFTGFSGPGFFVYSVTDSNGCLELGTLDVNVNSLAASNTGVRDCSGGTVNGSLIPLVGGGVPPYTYGPTGGSVGGSVNINPSGVYSFTPNTGFNGTGGFGYQVTDSFGCISTGAIEVLVSSLIAGNTAVRDCVGGSVSGNLSDLITSGFAPFTFGLTGSPVGGNANVNPGGIYFFTASPGFTGNGGFVYEVTDSIGCLSTGSVDVTVSSPIAGSTAVRDCVGGSISGSLTGLVTSGFPPYTFGLTGAPVGGSANVNVNGIYTFSANPGFTGDGGFTYQVTDSIGCLSTGSVDVTVSSPIAGNTAINLCYNSATAGNLSGLVTSGFPPYTFGLTGSPVGGSATVSSTGLYTFNTDTGFSGPGGFVYQVTDTNACLSTGSVQIDVDNLIAQSTSITICNDILNSNLQSLVSGGVNPLIFTGPLGVSCTGSSVIISPTGNYTYTSPSGFTGPCNFVYQVDDALGCSSTGSVTIIANTAPTVTNGTLVTCENTAVTDSLASLVVGNPPPPLTFAIVSQPTNGTLTSFNATTGAYTYTPNANFSGNDSFTFTVTDSGTPPCTTNIGTVNITVNPNPVVVGSLIIPCANQSISDSLAGLVQGNPPQPLTFALVTLPQFGTITNFNPSTGAYTYTPNTDYIGLDGFTFQVTDGNGCVSNTGVITIDVILCCPLSTDPLMQLILQLYGGMTGAMQNAPRK